MELPDIYKAMKYMAQAGGNFGYIAQNMAVYYYIVDNYAKFPMTEEQKLFATALLDTFAYLQMGEMTVNDIGDAVLWAKAGTVRLNFYAKTHGVFNCDSLLNLTMQIEALIFENDTDVDYHDIVDMVVDNKQIISEMIEKTLDEGTKCRIFNDVFPSTMMNINDPDFQKLVHSFDL